MGRGGDFSVMAISLVRARHSGLNRGILIKAVELQKGNLLAHKLCPM